VQCITAAKFGSLLAWFVMSAPNCCGLILILCAANWLINISQLLCILTRYICHSCRNTTLSKNLLDLPCCFVYIATSAVFSSHSYTKLWRYSTHAQQGSAHHRSANQMCGGGGTWRHQEYKYNTKRNSCFGGNYCDGCQRRIILPKKFVSINEALF
jgi:hypothetical protein